MSTHNTDGRLRVGAAFTNYYESHRRRHKNRTLLNPMAKVVHSDNSYQIRERHLRHLQSILEEDGITHLQYMNQEHIDRAFEECVDSIQPRLDTIPAPNTMKAVVASLKAFVRYHSERDAIKPAKVKFLLDNLPSIKKVNRRMLIIPGEHWPEIFTLAHKRHFTDRMLLELSYRLAMRLSEALQVRWCDFSPDFTEVYYFRQKRSDVHKTKTNENLKATLTEYHAYLTDLLGYPPDKSWPIVLARPRSGGQGAKVQPWWPVNPGRPMDDRTAGQAIKSALLAFGIKPAEMLCQAMHIARRSRACHLFRLKVDIRIIALILGHDNFVTTLDYIRDGLDDEEIQAAMDLPDKPAAPELKMIGSLHDLSPDNLPTVPHSKEALANATLVFLQSGFLSEDESKAMLMRVLNNY